MKLYSISNISSFMNCVRNCTGEVILEDKDGQLHDLKALANSIKGIENQIIGGKLDELTVYIRHPDDQFRMINYMAEMALVG